MFGWVPIPTDLVFQTIKLCVFFALFAVVRFVAVNAFRDFAVRLFI